MPKDSDNNKFFDDFSKLAGSTMDMAFSSLSQLKEHVETITKTKLESTLASMNLVKREEFEVVKAMAEKARLEQGKLEKRLKAMEKSANVSTK